MRFTLLLTLAFAAFSLGCGAKGPVTHKVKGKVQLASATPAVLAGHSLEAMLIDRPQVRAYGAIQEDGSFALETLHNGAVLPGAVPGKYNVRVVLGDDDAEQRRAAASAINPRFLNFDTSGLSFDVPAQGDVVLSLQN